MKKLYSLFLILTPIENVYAFQQFMSVSIAFVKNHEEMVKKDFASKNFKVKTKAIRTPPPLPTPLPHPPSMINHTLPSLCLELVIIYPWKCWNIKFITNAEAYLEPVNYLQWNFLASLFLPKSSIIDFRLGSKYATVMCNGRYLEVDFGSSNSQNFSGK